MDAFTALPNLHPALVHHPIALLTTAFALDLFLFAFRRPRWLDRAAAGAWGLGALSAVAAWFAGRRAADGLAALPLTAEPALARHADAAAVLVLGALFVAAVRVWLSAGASSDSGVPRTLPRAAALVAALALQVVVTVTADRGGALVFRHGVAVSAPGADGPATEVGDQPVPANSAPASEPGGATEPEPAEALSDGVVRSESGLEWRPQPGAALPFTDPPEGLRTAAPLEGAGLSADGPVLLLLPDAFGDVAVELEVDSAGFDGRFGLVHHAASQDDFELLLVEGGRAGLHRVSDGAWKRLGEGAVEGPVTRGTWTVSASGTHFKGRWGEATVVHAHASELAAGRVGLYLDGVGTLRVLGLRAQGLDDY